MDYNEAIKILIEKEHEIEEYGVTDLAIEALEKQIPKKPVKYECPVCKNSVGYKFGESYMMPYCENCGQKLDWD